MKERTDGFTLVEVMIACSVLAVILLGLGQTILVSQKQTQALSEDYAILSGCQKVMDDILELPLEEILKQDEAKFGIRLGYSEKQELSGVIKISRDLDGDGKIERDAPFYEGRKDAVRLSLYFRGKCILHRIVTDTGRVFR